jgi:hypothetical protein
MKARTERVFIVRVVQATADLLEAVKEKACRCSK